VGSRALSGRKRIQVEILGLLIQPLAKEKGSGRFLASIASEIGLTDALLTLFELVRQFQL
jgi:hypothetical protein